MHLGRRDRGNTLLDDNIGQGEHSDNMFKCDYWPRSDLEARINEATKLNTVHSAANIENVDTKTAAMAWLNGLFVNTGVR